MTFAALLQEIDALATRPEGVKREYAMPATPTSIAHAKRWLTDTHEEVWCQTPYNPAQIGPDNEGGVCFQWWSGKRKITVYVVDEEAWVSSSLGPHGERPDERWECRTDRGAQAHLCLAGRRDGGQESYASHRWIPLRALFLRWQRSRLVSRRQQSVTVADCWRTPWQPGNAKLHLFPTIWTRLNRPRFFLSGMFWTSEV